MSISVYDQISEYLPSSTKRSLNRASYATDKEYCKKAAFIYHDDMVYVNDKFTDKVIYYYNDNYDIQATLTSNGVKYNYIIEQHNDNVVLSMTDQGEVGEMIDVDIMSKYKVLKNRGCEDNVPYYAKNNVIDLLLKTFVNKFNPDNMQDCLYLYMYLYTNSVLIGYDEPIIKNKSYKNDKLPPKSLLDDIYNLYNLLYVYLNLLEL